MSVKSILVHVDEHDGLPSVLECALLVAKQFGSHMEGLHVRPGVPRMIPGGAEGALLTTGEIIDDLERRDQEVAQRVRQRFDAFMRERGVPTGRGVPPGDEPSAGWAQKLAAGDDVLGSMGRVFDLIVVGRPRRGASKPSVGALEAALFESGRPVLMAPPSAPTGLGESVVIAWNGSTETARTIALAMPFLVRAKDVLVLSVEEGMVAGPTGPEVARNLLQHDIAARTKHVRGGSRAVGAVILEECAAAGADLLVKGAYTQSRFRQMIFGGATSHIIGAAEIPVVIAH